jgi:DNA polymerase
MPIYEYECERCTHRCEELVSSPEETPRCPACGANDVKRLLSAVSPPGRLPRGPKVRGRPAGAACGNEASQGGRRVARERRVSLTVEERRARLVEVYEEASTCVRCPLSETRTKVVFGAGNADADLMFVGEAPGAEEDRQGLPFVGRAGGLLNELLGGIGLAREDVFIANVLKCRPPGNRDPQPLEIESCRPYLFEQARLIEPKVVCTLGNFATKLLSGSQTGITKVRGTPQVRELGERTVFLFPIFHPAAALRTPSMADTLREDFAKLPDLLAGPLPDTPEPVGGGADEEGPVQPPRDDQLDLFG